jgi:ribonuclease HII
MGDAERHDSKKNGESALRVPLFENIVIDGIGVVFEDQARAEGFRFIAGVDEVGRGCLAGPVVAAACILDPAKPLHKKLNDSKKLAAALRDEIADQLRSDCVAFAIGQIEADEIDQINILEATKKAMKLAVASLSAAADFLLIDAVQLRDLEIPQRAIIKGDSISASIAAASILAKTHRDKLMADYEAEYPQYGFASHVGYGTAAHFRALREHGPCPLHRKTFRGVV